MQALPILPAYHPEMLPTEPGHHGLELLQQLGGTPWQVNTVHCTIPGLMWVLRIARGADFVPMGGSDMQELAAWIKDMLDSQQSPSFGRAGAGFVVYFLVVWGCYIVSKTAVIPDVPYGWITIVGILWGVTGLKEAYTKGKEIAANATGSAADT